MQAASRPQVPSPAAVGWRVQRSAGLCGHPASLLPSGWRPASKHDADDIECNKCSARDQLHAVLRCATHMSRMLMQRQVRYRAGAGLWLFQLEVGVPCALVPSWWCG